MTRRTAIIEIDPRTIQLLTVNARSMQHARFQRLVDNIKQDGYLESTPLCAIVGLYAEGDEPARDTAGDIIFEVLSGNHRTRAAIAAGLQTIRILAILDPVPKSERIAKQLAHNAIEGEDDPAVLKQLYEELDIDLKQYAALDDKTLASLAEVKVGTLAEANLQFQPLTFLFLPHEAERVKALVEQARKIVPGDVYLARWGEYDRLLDTLTDVGAAHMVRNASAQLLLMLDLVERYLGELRGGWLDDQGRAKHDKTAPLSSLFEATAIPTKHAVVIARALKEAKARELTPAAAVAQWAERYLASLKEGP